MWKKGSYDVTSGRHQRFDHSNAVFSYRKHGQKIINLFQRIESMWSQLKRLSEAQDKLVPLIAALFVVIFVLIGVIIWLSVSIHLIKVSLPQSPTTTDETDDSITEKLNSPLDGTLTESIDIKAETVTTSSSHNQGRYDHLPLPPSQKQLLQSTTTKMTPTNDAKLQEDPCIELLKAVFHSTDKRIPLEVAQLRRGNRQLRNAVILPESTTTTNPKEILEVESNGGCDCKNNLPQNQLGNADKTKVVTQDVEEIIFTTIGSDDTSKSGDAKKAVNPETEVANNESSDKDVSEEEDQSKEMEYNQNSPIYYSHGNTIISMNQSPLIIARCGPYVRIISNSETAV